GLDLAPAEQPALGMDLFRRKNMALQRRFTEYRPRTGQERHMSGLEGGVGYLALRRLAGRFHQLGSGHQAGAGEPGSPDCDAESAEKIPARGRFLHGVSPVM